MDKINKITNSEGYIWLSNESKPKIIKIDDTVDINSYTNPFIVEGYLYDRKNEISYTIKYVDGNVKVWSFTKKILDGKECVSKSYIANTKFDKEIEKLNFKEIWTPMSDEQCNGWKVLQMQAVLFVGFERKEEKHATV